jgi:hypothetical protein
MLSFAEWIAQNNTPASGVGSSTPTAIEQPTAGTGQLSFADWQAKNPTGMAQTALSGGPVNWQGLYDPMQEYYWKTQLGGKNVQTRDLLGYDDPHTEAVENLSEADIKNTDWYKYYSQPSLGGIGRLPEDIYSTADWLRTDDRGENGSFHSVNLDALRQYGDWKDTNIQDFFSSAEQYRNTDRKQLSGDLSELSSQLTDPNYAAWDTGGLNFGDLGSDKALQSLLREYEGVYDRKIGAYSPASSNWLTDQNINLREGTGWNPSTGITGTDAHTRAMQAGLLSDAKGRLRNNIVWDPDLHMNADMTNPKKYADLAKGKYNMFDPVSSYLNSYGSEVGDTDTNFFQHNDNTKWDDYIHEMNPSSLKKFARSPAFGAILGIATAGLGLPGMVGNAIGSATGLSPGTAAMLGKGVVSAGTNALSTGLGGGDFGDIGKSLLTGGVTGGLNALSSNYLTPFLSDALGNDSVSKIVSGGLTQGALSSINGGDFGTGLLSGAVGSGMNEYVAPELSGLTGSQSFANWLSSAAGKEIVNQLTSKKR